MSVTLRHALGTVIKLADQGLINRNDHMPKCDIIAASVIEMLQKRGVVLDWDGPA